MPKKTEPLKPALHLLLTDDYIAAANHGAPFSKEGLRATCRAQTSPKEQDQATPIKDAKDAKACMEEIWQAWIADYQTRPDAPARHAAAERDIGDKLKRVLIREFISNASDANSGKPFGGKGLGLRTILSICDRPRVHSGPLSFCFDRHLGQKALKEGLGGKVNLSDTPLMRLPFPVPRSKEPARLKKLIETYDTVIILPFRSKKIREEFLSEWDDFVDDVTTLLYLPGLDHVIWERDDAVEKTKRTWVRERGR
ncbi:MAG: hypothetical protein OEM91_10230, partial [Hyphomicrobiales bacterium]|nr:hypothetical protein [Hyphomicrobiales bacterium]